ncbi:MAG: hypothetical protein D6704_12600 [Nitrospirae bacterium]|nr:MAG: hypothetical protein D6704_12600 [Nitrospirota bacterium]
MSPRHERTFRKNHDETFHIIQIAGMPGNFDDDCSISFQISNVKLRICYLVISYTTIIENREHFLIKDTALVLAD